MKNTNTNKEYFGHGGGGGGGSHSGGGGGFGHSGGGSGPGRGGGGGERGSRSSVVFGLISSPPVAAAADASLSLSFSLHSLPPSILSMATLSLSKLTLRPVRPRRR